MFSCSNPALELLYEINQSIASKVLERLFMARLKDHVGPSKNFNKYQSAYRQYHSTETIRLKILDDVYAAADKKKENVPCCPRLVSSIWYVRQSRDSRAAWRWVLELLALHWIGLAHTVLPYPGRSHTYGVPQGSVLGPMLFSLFVSPIAHGISSFGVFPSICWWHAIIYSLKSSIKLG